MKNDKTPWNSLGLLTGVVIAVLALAQGKLRNGLLLAVFVLWGIWMAVYLLSPRIKRRKRAKAHRPHKEAAPELFRLTDADDSPAEQLLLRHVNHRISAYLRSVYPDITWEWSSPKPEKIILRGGVGRIRVFGVPDFDHADIRIDRQANISCSMVKTVPLNTTREQESAEDKLPPGRQPVDPQIWYEVHGRKVLETLVADLNSRGHTHMVLHEDGDICVTEDKAEVAKEHFDNFPEKLYWERLVQVLERNGLAAEVTAAGIRVSW